MAAGVSTVGSTPTCAPFCRSKSNNMRRRLLLAAAFGLMFFVGPNAVFAHGVGYRESAVRPISLEFYYSTGETMSYLEAKVYSPKDEKFAYQSGRTDEDGRFAFTPNAEGQWRIQVKDEEGHAVEAKIDVTREYLNPQTGTNENSSTVVVAPSGPEGKELYVRAALGVSVLFNIAAAMLVFRRGRRA